MTAPAERRPSGAGWALLRSAAGVSWWRSGGVTVGSELAVADYPDGSGVGPQWLVSVSENGGRPSRHALRAALKAFGMLGTEEDNHHPGIARHFWLPVDPSKRVDCQCKASEVTVADGAYRWTNPVDGPCRGCELQGLTGRPCPLHPAPAAGAA